jgi:hypothetical protein
LQETDTESAPAQRDCRLDFCAETGPTAAGGTAPRTRSSPRSGRWSVRLVRSRGRRPRPEKWERAPTAQGEHVVVSKAPGRAAARAPSARATPGLTTRLGARASTAPAELRRDGSSSPGRRACVGSARARPRRRHARTRRLGGRAHSRSAPPRIRHGARRAAPPAAPAASAPPRGWPRSRRGSAPHHSGQARPPRPHASPSPRRLPTKMVLSSATARPPCAEDRPAPAGNPRSPAHRRTSHPAQRRTYGHTRNQGGV